MRFGNWLFTCGDLFRIVGWSGDGPVLANWSRPRLDYLCARLRGWL